MRRSQNFPARRDARKAARVGATQAEPQPRCLFSAQAGPRWSTGTVSGVTPTPEAGAGRTRSWWRRLFCGTAGSETRRCPTTARPPRKRAGNPRRTVRNSRVLSPRIEPRTTRTVPVCFPCTGKASSRWPRCGCFLFCFCRGRVPESFYPPPFRFPSAGAGEGKGPKTGRTTWKPFFVKKSVSIVWANSLGIW